MATLLRLMMALGMNTEEFKKKMKEVDTEAASKGTKIGNAFSSVGSSMQGVGATMSATMTAPIMAAGMAAVNAASDLNETMSKVDVVFGESAAAVQAFGDKAASGMGMSKNAALSAAGTYGNLFVSMGMTNQASADMSMGLVTLAGDLASFNNMNPEEVLEKLRAGLTGETEPLKSLGVNISQATLEAKALSMGLGTTTANMDKVKSATDGLSKAQAALSALTKGAGQDSQEAYYANVKLNGAQLALKEAQEASQKALVKYGKDSEQWAKTQQTVSERVMALQKAQEAYNVAVGGYPPESEKVKKAQEAVMAAQAKVDAAMQGGKTTLSAAEKAQASYALIMEQTATAQGDFERTSSGLANSTRIVKAQLEDTAAKMGAQLLPIALQLVQAVSKLTTWFTNLSPAGQKTVLIIAGIAAAIGPVIGIIGTLMTVIGGITTFLAGPAAAAIGAIIAPMLPIIGIILAIVAVVALVYFAWKNNWGGIRDIVANVGAAIANWWGQVSTTFQNFVAGVQLLAARVSSGWTALIATFTRLPGALRTYLVGAFQNAVAAVQTWLNNAIKAVINFGLMLWKAYTAPYIAVFNFVKNIWKSITNAVQSAINGVIKGITSKMDQLDPNWRSDWEKIKQALQQKWNDMIKAVEDAWNRIIAAIVKAVTTVYNTLVSWATKIVQAVAEWWEKIRSAVAAAWNSIVSAVSNAINKLVDAVRQFATPIIQAVQAWWDGVKNAVATAWASIVAAISTAVWSVVTAITSYLTPIVAAVQSWWDGIKNGVAAAWTAIVQAVGAAIDTAYTAITGTIDKFKKIGQDIIQGIIDGFHSWITKLEEAAAELALAIINKLKDLLGIPSPSKVMNLYGRNIGQGLAKGILATEGLVRNAMGSLSLAASPSFGISAQPIAGVQGVTNGGGMGGYRDSHDTYNIFTKDQPGQIQNALTLSRMMGGAA